MALFMAHLRAMLKDARRTGAITQNLFDRDLFSVLPLTDTETSIDPSTPDERELILDDFRTTSPHYYPFVYHQFWTGSRPSEACALRVKALLLVNQREKIERSRVQGQRNQNQNEAKQSGDSSTRLSR